MTCSHCTAMAAELAELREAIGLAEMSGSVFAVREALGLSPTTARLVLKLYSAAGRGSLASASGEGALTP